MKSSTIKTVKILLAISRFLTLLCNPILIPTIGFVALFTISYLIVFPIQYKLSVLGLIFTLTYLMPVLLIVLYLKLNSWTYRSLIIHRERRLIPYILVVICYLCCLYVMYRINMPRCMIGIVVSALLSMIICMIINHFWKVSVHMAGMGQLIGGIIAFSLIFYYNPIVWLSLFILLAGAQGSSSIIVRHHSLAQVLTGQFLGLICGLSGILFL